ncbi:MAG: HU family DNA-binding protein [Oscillospiraceae bacterium]|nr:HU family DNA-binding protein [Oscillospiraceae bacterium]
MNKSELAAEVAARTGQPKKETELALSVAFDIISGALEAGERVQLAGFGVFDVKERAARIGRNPRTKEEIRIEASRIPVFRPGRALRELIDK